MEKVPEVQRPHTNVERPEFITAAFLYCAARYGHFLKLSEVLKRTELQRSQLQNAIGIFANTLVLPASPFDKAQWAAQKKPPPPLKVTGTAAPTVLSVASKDAKDEKESTKAPEPSSDAATTTAPTAATEAPASPAMSWRDAVLQEFEAKRKENEQQVASGLQPKRKKLRQTTLLF